MTPRAMFHTRLARAATRQRGFAYMALMVFFGVFIAVAGAAMLSGAMLQRRTSEEQLIFVGGEFRRAIEAYYLASLDAPPGNPRYPQRLDDLLADPRSKELRRYLRQIYPDPLTGSTNWGTVAAPDGGIMGVYSRSPAKAVKLFGFPAEFKYLEGKKTIAEWQFLYIAPVLPTLPAQAAPATPADTSPATSATPSITPSITPSTAPSAAQATAQPVTAPSAPGTQPPALSPSDVQEIEKLLKTLGAGGTSEDNNAKPTSP